MVTTGEFSANVMSVHIKDIQERKLYTGEEKGIGIRCAEIKCPKSSAIRSLQTVMLCRGSQTTVEGCSLHRNHIRAASFMSSLGQCLVEKGWFYGTLGKEQWKPWIFSLTFLFSVDRNKSCCSALAPLPQSCSKTFTIAQNWFALKCQWGSPTANWKRECNIFSFLCSTHLQSQMEWVGF